MMSSPKFRIVDLFAGIGGIRKGFELAADEMNAHVETVFVSEFDRYAVLTYSENFESPAEKIADADDYVMQLLAPRAGKVLSADEAKSNDASNDARPVIYGDITKLTDEALSSIPDFDVCLAGFPCQAFSLAGQRMGLEDDYRGMSRGTLFREIIRICDAKKPKAVVCENVKGLLHHDSGRTIEIIEGAFREAGYEPIKTILNSKDFGVPQNRERLYLVALRADIPPDGFDFPSGSQEATALEDVLEKKPVSSKYYLSEGYLNTLKRHRERHQANGHGFGYCIRGSLDVAGTICCGGMGRERNLIVDEKGYEGEEVTTKHSPINKEYVRMLTPREWARLQGFPDDFALPVADTHLYKQLGNTVTVPVIEAVAKKVLQHLKTWEKSDKAKEERRKAVLERLELSPCSRSELVEAVSPFYLSGVDAKRIANGTSYILRVLENEGEVSGYGRGRGAVWYRLD